ncbi:MAG: hypothetical protein QF440_03875 [Candidatus Thalassarchaeaceae archaeon]|jgi:hypothetical protein|nr:hypothetical protein [Candidatus Thalassarchaeaceae archaeon]
MSGGLLEKAKQKNDEPEGVFSATGDPENPDLKEHKKVLDAEPSGSGGLLSKFSATSPSSNSKPIMLYAAAGSLFVSMILIFMLSSLPEYSGFAVLALFLASFGVAFMHIKNDRNLGKALTGAQWGTLIVAYLLLGAVPYVGGMDFSGRTTLVDAEYDDATDTFTMSMRYTSGLLGSSAGTTDVHVKVLYDGDEVWDDEIEVEMSDSSEGGEMGTFTINANDFYSGNAYYVSGSSDGVAQLSEHKYEVFASIDGTASGSVSLPSQNLTRTVNDIDAEIDPFEEGNCDNSYSSCVKRLYINGAVGISSIAEDASTVPMSIRGAYTVSVAFTYVDNDMEMLSYPIISVAGTRATWDNSDYGSGLTSIGERTATFSIEGDVQDSVDLWYFDRDTALDDYGCYKLDVSATQFGPDAAGGSGYTMPSIFYEYKSNSDEDMNWETFEAVSSC